jgi:hypothetical protein
MTLNIIKIYKCRDYSPSKECSFEQHVELQDLLSLVGSRVTDIADLVSLWTEAFN